MLIHHMENIVLIPKKDVSYYFWYFGLSNNILFVLILSSLESLYPKNISIIALCTILPGLIVKISIPLWINYKFLNYYNKTVIIVISYIISYLFITLNSNYLFLIGVILSSFSSSFGDTIFIPLSIITSKKSISYWSAGTGSAGIIGSTYYLLLYNIFNLNARIILLSVIWLPILIMYFFNKIELSELETYELNYNQLTRTDLNSWIFNYIIPLSSTYFNEYLINLAILPKIIRYSQNKQKIYYPIFIFFYQLGVLISRSSKICIIKKNVQNLYIFSTLQFINLIICLLIAIYQLVDKPYIIYIIIFYVGLISGFSYVFTFSKITNEVCDEKKEMCSLTVSIGDISGQTLASLVSLFVKIK